MWVCDGSRLLISPGWSWAHRPVISLLQHLSGCYLIDSEWWVSRGEMQRCGCVMEADCWSHLVDLERIGQWSRSFSTYLVVFLDPEWWVSRRRDAEVRVCDGSRLLISPGWSWAHRPVISLLHHLSGCRLGSEWWVSRGSDAEVRVCDGRRLLISPGWSWAHRPVISLLHHLSGCR